MKPIALFFRIALLMPAVLAAIARLGAAPAADAVVAPDGSGNYTSIRDAIDAAPQITRDDGRRWTILVKPGTYRELVYVQREKRFVALIGEPGAAEKTVLTYNLFANTPGPDGKPIGTFRTPTLLVDADDFTVENLTIENAAGPKGQALALRVDGDRVTFRGCRFLGWQDTILVNRGRHYFEDCLIVGATDFIFGGATAWFERCRIRVDGNGYITAASTPDFQAHGFVFAHGTIEGGSPQVRTFLGRPWRDYAQTVFLECEMSDVVRPEGWNNWNKPQAEKTTVYAEYRSRGAGGKVESRAPWSRQLSASDAARYTVRAVLGGSDGWDPTRARAGR